MLSSARALQECRVFSDTLCLNSPTMKVVQIRPDWVEPALDKLPKVWLALHRLGLSSLPGFAK